MGAPVTPTAGSPPDAPSVPALVLCGGRGTRLGTDVEKPLVPVCGEPMFDRVVRALDRSAVSAVHAVTSPATPGTRARARDLGLTVVDAPGDGYVADLQYAFDAVPPPVLTVVADLPHLDAGHVDRALADAVVSDSDSDADPDRAGASAGTTPAEHHELASLTVCVPVALKRALGVSVDTQFDHGGRAVAPTGLNVVGTGEETESENVSVVADERLAVNVNRPGDREVAESRCG